MGGSLQGYVYFIRCAETGLIKIGWTMNAPEDRLEHLRGLSPTPLEGLGILEGGRELEGGFHDRFSEHRDHGEWFRPGPSLRAFVESGLNPWPEVEKGVWRRYGPLRLDEAARYLGEPPEAVEKLHAEGRLPTFKRKTRPNEVGLLFAQRDLDRYREGRIGPR
jgi:hypothetical protein